MNQTKDFIVDEIYGDRLLISTRADQRELKSNIRAAYAILNSFPDVYIIINPHTISFGHKNPEYTIDQKLGDRKGIMSEKGVTAGFKSAKKQGCKVVVIDLDEHIWQVRPFELSKYIARRKGVSGFSRLAGRLIKNKVVPLQHGSYNASSSHPSGCAYRQLRCCQF